MTAQRRADRSSLFATGAVALACTAALALIVLMIAGSFRSGSTPESVSDTRSETPVDVDDGAIADPDVNPSALMRRAATAMADVASVEFRLERDGAPVFIDQFEEIALDSLRGQFTVPTRARAELTVTIDENLTTKIGAVAIDSEVWISNPVTGDFETLPAGYDIDPSRFFDPSGGWQPLIANLAEVELIEIASRGGDRYHVRGTAGADDIRNITVGLVRDQDVPVDFWIHPTTALVTAAEFTTVIDGGEARWVLELENFGVDFTIDPPENVRG